MLKINNKSKLITTEEIEKCINLLQKIYKELNYKINIYQHKYQLIFEFLLGNVDLDVFKGKIAGQHCSNTKEINLYIFNMYCDYPKENINKFLKLQFIHSLFHEIRHGLQCKLKLRHYEYETANYIKYGDDYKKQWIEIDAQKFAKRTMKKYHKEISNILDCHFEWDVQ